LLLLAVNLLPDAASATSSGGSTLVTGSFYRVLSNVRYLLPALSAAMAFAGAFVFVLGGPFLLVESRGMTPYHYGLLCGLILSGYVVTSACAGRLTDAWGKTRVTQVAWLLLATGTGVIVISALASHGESVTGLVTGLILYELGLGLLLPCCQARALAGLGTKDTDTGAGLLFFLEIAVASVAGVIMASLPLTNTLVLAFVVLASAIMAGLFFVCEEYLYKIRPQGHESLT